jgi:hypothetical protein
MRMAFLPKSAVIWKKFLDSTKGLKPGIFRLVFSLEQKMKKIFYFSVAFLKILHTIIGAGERNSSETEDLAFF